MLCFDLFTPPTTTEEMRQDALNFLETTGKPTPDHIFSQDGCSLFFDSLLWHDFTEACLAHDIRYWAGGPISERENADLALRNDIVHTGPLGPAIAPLMYSGVRIFGNSFITKAVGAHWGYGWDQ